jgi:hypothetical protein
MRAIDLLRLLLVFAGGGMLFPIAVGALTERIQLPGWMLFSMCFFIPYLSYRKTLRLTPRVQSLSAWTKYAAVHGLSLLLTLLTLVFGLVWIWIAGGASA